MTPNMTISNSSIIESEKRPALDYDFAGWFVGNPCLEVRHLFGLHPPQILTFIHEFLLNPLSANPINCSNSQLSLDKQTTLDNLV